MELLKPIDKLNFSFYTLPILAQYSISFLPKMSENQMFLTLSGGKEIEYWTKIG